MPIKEKIERIAAGTPEKKAFVIGKDARTFKELADRATWFSSYIQTLKGNRHSLPYLAGVEKLVALGLGNHLLFPELFLGATDCKNACAVLDTKMHPAQIENILTRLKPDLVVTETTDDVIAQIARRVGLRVLSATELLEAPHETGAQVAPGTSEATDDIFLVNFTSGTTTQPKAFIRSRSSWCNSLTRGRTLFGLTDSPTTLCPGALAHGLALYALVETLDSGGTFHAVRQWDREVVADTLATNKIERLVAVPTMIDAIAKSTDGELPFYPNLKHVLTAGAKLNRNHVNVMKTLFPAARIMEYYGASELGFITVATVHPMELATPIDTVGRAFPGVEITIRNSHGQPAESEVAGTIYVKSDLISDGYLWGNDGRAFRSDKNGATVGDIGVLDQAGALKVLGREGGMVITGGFNVYPSEIESVLKEIRGIDDAVVVGVDDTYLGKRIVAIVRGQFLDFKQILEEISDALPRYKVPRDFYVLENWPMTTSGKVARGKLERMLLDGVSDLVRVAS